MTAILSILLLLAGIVYNDVVMVGLGIACLASHCFAYAHRMNQW